MDAAFTLAVIAPDEIASVPILGEVLADPKLPPEWRAVAADLLGRIGTGAEAAMPQLRQGLGDEDSALRSLSAISLVKIARAEAIEAVPALREALRTGSTHVRQEAAYCIGRIGRAAKSAKPELTQALQDEDDLVQKHAALSLSRLDPADLKPVPILRRTAADATVNPLFRCFAFFSIAEAVGPEAKDLVPVLSANYRREVVKENRELIRDALILIHPRMSRDLLELQTKWLGAIQDDNISAHDVFISMFETDGYERLRRGCARRFARMCIEGNLDELATEIAAETDLRIWKRLKKKRDLGYDLRQFSQFPGWMKQVLWTNTIDSGKAIWRAHTRPRTSTDKPDPFTDVGAFEDREDRVLISTLSFCDESRGPMDPVDCAIIDPSAKASQRELLDRVYDLLQSEVFDKRDSLALSLRYFRDARYKDIARALSIDADHARYIVNRTLLLLGELMD